MRRINKINALIFLLTIVLFGCASVDRERENIIRVSILGSIEEGTIDASFVQGARLYAEEFNSQANGYSIVIDLLEDSRTYEGGVTAAAELSKDSRVTAVINLQDYTVAETSSDILSKGGKISILPFGGFERIMKKGYDNVFMLYPSFSDIGKAMGSFAAEHDYTRIAVYCNGTESEKEVLRGFESALMNSESKIIDFVEDFATTSDFNKIYKRWEALETDCIVISTYEDTDAIKLMDMLAKKKAGIDILGDTVFYEMNLEPYNDILGNLSYPSIMETDEENPEYRSFAESYIQAYSSEPDYLAVQGYSCLRLLGSAVESVNSVEPAEIAKEIFSAEIFTRLGANLRFTAEGLLIADDNTIIIYTDIEGE